MEKPPQPKRSARSFRVLWTLHDRNVGKSGRGRSWIHPKTSIYQRITYRSVAMGPSVRNQISKLAISHFVELILIRSVAIYNRDEMVGPNQFWMHTLDLCTLIAICAIDSVSTEDTSRP